MLSSTPRKPSSAKRFEPSSPHKLDQVVINTNDGYCKEIYQDFNIVSLRQLLNTGKKNALFRLNKTTIEVIEQEDDLPPGDKMGLGWDVKDIKKAHQRLLDEGIEVNLFKKA